MWAVPNDVPVDMYNFTKPSEIARLLHALPRYDLAVRNAPDVPSADRHDLKLWGEGIAVLICVVMFAPLVLCLPVNLFCCVKACCRRASGPLKLKAWIKSYSAILLLCLCGVFTFGFMKAVSRNSGFGHLTHSFDDGLMLYRNLCDSGQSIQRSANTTGLLMKQVVSGVGEFHKQLTTANISRSRSLFLRNLCLCSSVYTISLNLTTANKRPPRR
jgi:hypothetical protein